MHHNNDNYNQAYTTWMFTWPQLQGLEGVWSIKRTFFWGKTEKLRQKLLGGALL